MTDALLCAYNLGGKPGPITLEELRKGAPDQVPVWCHLDAGHPEARNVISSLGVEIPDIAVSALVAEDTRPRFTLFDNSFLLNLRGMNFNEDADPEDMVSIRLWSDGKYILTTQMRSLRVIKDMQDSINKGEGPKSVGSYIATLAQNLTYRIDPTIDQMEEDVDALEEQLLGNIGQIDSGELLVLRRKAVLLTRHLVPQREALMAFVHNNSDLIKTKHRQSLNETLNQLNLYIEELESLRQRSFLIKEEISGNEAGKMNRNMYVLSIIASIFLPLGFFTGLLGINIGGIPGASYEYAFYVFSGILVIIVVFQYFLFKKKGWF